MLSVVRSRGRWLGVTSSELPNGRLGWVGRGRALRLSRTRLSIHVDTSERRLELRLGRRVVRAARVGVGRDGSHTPAGRFAVTDRLNGRRIAPYYGCCVLALSGRQPNLPPGWSGGNRLALHGTDSPRTVGRAASAGCLHALERDLWFLIRSVRLGTPVFIRP